MNVRYNTDDATGAVNFSEAGGQNMKEFAKKETVFLVAALLAFVSLFLVPPDAKYADYIDFRTLALLFTLMTVMEGQKQLGVFDRIARVILKKTDSLKKLAFTMVFLCFFSSMLITNDVALITFVPFTLLLLSVAGCSDRAIPIIVFETVAANLGSMLTPVGNPQNLYLYTASGLNITEFFIITAPVTALSAFLLGLGCLCIKNVPMQVTVQDDRKELKKANKGSKAELFFFCFVFLLALLTVLRLVPFYIPFLTALFGTLLLKPAVLRKIDYFLLLTFICFFIFIGNMGRVENVSEWLQNMMQGRELLISFFASQVISNVPAAILLSGFTDQFKALILGTNIGGLGTLIASLASLISYKAFVQENPQKKGKYFLYFTFVNVIFAVVLLLFAL